MSVYKRGRWSGRRTTHMTEPKRQVRIDVPQCTFCSNQSVTRCEYPDCNLPLCHKCRIRKGGGNLCRHHRDARLVQFLGEPSPGAVPIEAEIGRFAPKGPAVPHF
jgi:hypothetical protein